MDWEAEKELLVMAGTSAGRHIVDGEAGRIETTDTADDEGGGGPKKRVVY